MLYGCSSDRFLSDVPLVWKPTKDSYDAGTATLTGVYSHKYKVMPFVDSRENKKVIAKNIEDNRGRLVTTCDDVADWCRNRFISIVKQYGFNIEENNANIIIKGEILEFYVIEDNLYNANVGIKITAENVAGDVLWQGMMIGKSKRFGHSYKLENYYEALSDAYISAVNGLLKNHEFIAALQKK
jgi:hypothetical protein